MDGIPIEQDDAGRWYIVLPTPKPRWTSPVFCPECEYGTDPTHECDACRSASEA